MAKKKIKTAEQLAASIPSKIAVSAFTQTGGGFHGKRGDGRTKQDPRSRSEVKSNLRYEDN